jgi:hypothetical protein
MFALSLGGEVFLQDLLSLLLHILHQTNHYSTLTFTCQNYLDLYNSLNQNNIMKFIIIISTAALLASSLALPPILPTVLGKRKLPRGHKPEPPFLPIITRASFFS